MSHQVQLSPAASHRPTAVLDPARHATEPPACRSRCPYSPAGNAPDTVPPWKSDLHGHLSHALGAGGASGPGRCSRKVTTRRDLPTHTPADLYASDCSAPGWWWRPERAICRTRHFRVPQRDQRLAQCVVVRVRIPRHGFATARSDPCRRGLVASNRAGAGLARPLTRRAISRWSRRPQQPFRSRPISRTAAPPCRLLTWRACPGRRRSQSASPTRRLSPLAAVRSRARS